MMKLFDKFKKKEEQDGDKPPAKVEANNQSAGANSATTSTPPKGLGAFAGASAFSMPQNEDFLDIENAELDPLDITPDIPESISPSPQPMASPIQQQPQNTQPRPAQPTAYPANPENMAMGADNLYDEPISLENMEIQDTSASIPPQPAPILQTPLEEPQAPEASASVVNKVAPIAQKPLGAPPIKKPLAAPASTTPAPKEPAPDLDEDVFEEEGYDDEFLDDELLDELGEVPEDGSQNGETVEPSFDISALDLSDLEDLDDGVLKTAPKKPELKRSEEESEDESEDEDFELEPLVDDVTRGIDLSDLDLPPRDAAPETQPPAPAPVPSSAPAPVEKIQHPIGETIPKAVAPTIALNDVAPPKLPVAAPDNLPVDTAPAQSIAEPAPESSIPPIPGMVAQQNPVAPTMADGPLGNLTPPQNIPTAPPPMTGTPADNIPNQIPQAPAEMPQHMHDTSFSMPEIPELDDLASELPDITEPPNNRYERPDFSTISAAGIDDFIKGNPNISSLGKENKTSRPVEMPTYPPSTEVPEQFMNEIGSPENEGIYDNYDDYDESNEENYDDQGDDLNYEDEYDQEEDYDDNLDDEGSFYDDEYRMKGSVEKRLEQRVEEVVSKTLEKWIDEKLPKIIEKAMSNL